MGVTKRQSLKSLIEQMKRAGRTEEQLASIREQLTPVKVERGTEYLIAIFNELSTRRQTGMTGPMPLSFQEIDAYNKLTDAQLTPWEISAITAMDAAFLDAIAHQEQQGSSVNK